MAEEGRTLNSRPAKGTIEHSKILCPKKTTGENEEEEGEEKEGRTGGKDKYSEGLQEEGPKNLARSKGGNVATKSK